MYVAAVLFWTCLLWLAYAYAGYPLAVWSLSRFRAVRALSGEYEPHVSMIISAHNEESVIRGKIEDSLSLDYPADKLEVIVASDGSTDGTDRIIGEYGGRVVHVRREWSGKTALLNHVVPKASGEVVVFSDADSVYSKDALRRLVRRMEDPLVGCVSGSIRYVSSGGTAVEGLYQAYEEWVKRLESDAYSILGANGGIYAIRKELYGQIPPEYPNDAYHPPYVVSKGYRAVYEKDAVATEPYDKGIVEEYARKKRIIVQAISQAGYVLGIRNRPLYILMYVSHKPLRWFAYIPLTLLFASSGLLAGSWPYGAAWYAQAGFWLLASAGLLAELGGLRLPVLKGPAYFALVNLAALDATVDFLLGARKARW